VPTGPKAPPKELPSRSRARAPTGPRGGKGKKVATVLNWDEHSASGAASGYSAAVADVSSDEDAAAAGPVATRSNGAAAGYMQAAKVRYATDPAKMAAGYVPTTEVRGVVGSLKRQERMLDEAIELLDGHKKEMQMLRSDVRGTRGAVSQVQEQFADVAEQTSRLTASNKSIALMLTEINDKLDNGVRAAGPRVGAEAGAAAGAGPAAGAGAVDGGVVGGDDDNGNYEEGPRQIPRAHWGPDLRVSFGRGVECSLVERRRVALRWGSQR